MSLEELWHLRNEPRSYSERVELLLGHLDAEAAKGMVTDLVIFEDEPEDPLDPSLCRFLIKYREREGRPVICTGIAPNRERALLKALAEAVERTCFYDRGLSWRTLDCSANRWSDAGPVLESTNGLAFHTEVQPCLLASLCELVERHHLALHWYTAQPALGRLNCQRLPLLGQAEEVLRSQGADFHALLLDRLGPLTTVGLLARTKREDVGFHLLFSTACGLELEPTLRRAWGELVCQYRSHPLLRALERGGPPDTVTSIEEHDLYYQRPDRLAVFDTLLDCEPCEPCSDLPAQEVGVEVLPSFLREWSIEVAVAQLPETLAGTWLMHCASPRLVNLGFGKRESLNRTRLEAILGRSLPGTCPPHPLP